MCLSRLQHFATKLVGQDDTTREWVTRRRLITRRGGLRWNGVGRGVENLESAADMCTGLDARVRGDLSPLQERTFCLQAPSGTNGTPIEPPLLPILPSKLQPITGALSHRIHRLRAHR